MRVRLNGTFGYGRPRVYYGPGVCEVPDGLARALGLAALPAPDEGAHEVGPQGIASHGSHEASGGVPVSKLTPFAAPDGQEPTIEERAVAEFEDLPPKAVKRGKR
jgi:hypothetical protein